MTGVVDLLFQAGGKWQVIDYKTGVAIDGAAAQKYAAQLDAYRRALEACGLTGVKTAMVPVRTGAEGV